MTEIISKDELCKMLSISRSRLDILTLTNRIKPDYRDELHRSFWKPASAVKIMEIVQEQRLAHSSAKGHPMLFDPAAYALHKTRVKHDQDQGQGETTGADGSGSDDGL